MPFTPEVRKVCGMEVETGAGEGVVVGAECSELDTSWGAEVRGLKKRMSHALF